MTTNKLKILFRLMFVLGLVGATASQTTNDAAESQPGCDAHELAKKLSNPVASLISFPFRLNSRWNVISRTIVPVIHQHNVANIGTQSGLGDVTQSFFFAPSENKTFIRAVGPALLIPTATDDFLGTKKFGMGPTVLALKQEHGWTYGALTNHIWSFAGSDDRASVNSTFIQPFLSYNTRDAWTYNINAESSYDWTGNHWSVPIHFTVSKVRFGKQPVSFGGGLRCWATSPAGGPEGCGLRIPVTPLFPK